VEEKRKELEAVVNSMLKKSRKPKKIFGHQKEKKVVMD
jgi:hypothetical protein